MASHEDVNTPLLALIGLLGSILVFAVIVLLTILYCAAGRTPRVRQNVGQPYAELDNLLASQRAKLVEYRWLDQKSKSVAIPIDRAMQLVVAGFSSQREGQAVKILVDWIRGAGLQPADLSGRYTVGCRPVPECVPGAPPSSGCTLCSASRWRRLRSPSGWKQRA